MTICMSETCFSNYNNGVRRLAPDIVPVYLYSVTPSDSINSAAQCRHYMFTQLTAFQARSTHKFKFDGILTGSVGGLDIADVRMQYQA